MPNEITVHSHSVNLSSVALTVARLSLTIDPPSPSPTADHLRGALAAIRPDLDLLHQHGAEGLIYRAPRVIYRVLGGAPTVIAVEEGVEAAFGLNLVGRTVRLGNTERCVIDLTLRVSRERLGERETPQNYRFLQPWLALNQENHRRFARMNIEQRRNFLNRQIVNNCLSLAKSFDVRLTNRLKAETNLRPVLVRHKNVPMLGFLGTIRMNFDIPDGLGVGKTVSKGFGGVERQEEP